MFDLMHEFPSRIIIAPAFDRDRVLGAILFEQTMDRGVDGITTPRYLGEHKKVVPFVKVDEGLAAEADGVRLMKPLTKLGDLVDRAVSHQVFGTKMRSFIHRANADGIAAVLDQQFAYARQILDAGLMPILEPEIDINSTEKVQAEELLKRGIAECLRRLPDGLQVMLKVSIPTHDDFYVDLIAHPKVLRVVALSGGYSRQEVNTRLANNHGLIASFSRALTEGLQRPCGTRSKPQWRLPCLVTARDCREQPRRGVSGRRCRGSDPTAMIGELADLVVQLRRHASRRGQAGVP
jgi:fructose-bisphosphate aldolase class I